jgi:DNA (cytosine-5)-methyltransferase 1
LKAVDLFAGSGGFTIGARLAGVEVLWAANHWPLAVQCHAENHPDVAHLCQDLQQADWTQVPDCDLVLASPCCQGHTDARGKDQPHHDASRATAWAVVSCCEIKRPVAFIVENVPEFLRWSLFPAWRQAMETLGYHLTTAVLDAADVGVPQHRERLFIVGSLRGSIRIAPGTSAHVPVREIIGEARWSPINKRGRAEATLARIAAGRERFGRRFVMPYYKSGSGLTGRSLDRPLGTVTTVDRWALVDGDRMRMLSVEEYRRAMSFPDDYKLPRTKREAVKLLGNAVPPRLACHVIQQTIEGLAA